MWTIFKAFVEFAAILLLFYVVVFVLFFFFWPRGMWDLSSLTRDGTRIPCIGRWSLNHWTAREVPAQLFIGSFYTFVRVCYMFICFVTVFINPLYIIFPENLKSNLKMVSIFSDDFETPLNN